jgi:phage baseplate assembly protein W
MRDDKELLGTGWEFPPRFEITTKTVGMLSGQEDVENSIQIIIETKMGERVMRNEFGSEIHDLLFEPLSANMRTYMTTSLKNALTRNEPRINVLSVDLEQRDPHLGRVDIKINYQTIDSRSTNNLVVPFYTPDNLYTTNAL